MTVFKTMQKRGLQPIDTILAALTTDAKTGQLPPLPTQLTEPSSNG